MEKLLVLLLLVATFGAASGTKPECGELTGTVVLKDDPDFCDVYISSNGLSSLGNYYKPVTLNFSQADETTLNTFLAKFTTIRGAIIMDGNEQVVTLDFRKLRNIDSDYFDHGVTMLIRNNPKLEKIDWNSTINIQNYNATMLIYNNPLLKSASLDPLRTELSSCKDIKHYIQKTGVNECQFEYPLSPAVPSNYTTPTADFLKKNCKKIKGDFILENANLTGLGSLELDPIGCLRLVNVDMKGVKIPGNSITGKNICKDGRKSELINNPNLCGYELDRLHSYYTDRNADIIQADRATCTMPCSPGEESLSGVYLYCVSTTALPPTAKITPSRNAPAGGLASPTQASSNKSSDSSNSGLSGWIIGVVVALIVLLIALFLFMWWMNWLPCCRRHDDKTKKGKGKKKKKQDSSKSTSKEKTTSKPSASSSANTASNEDVEAKPRKKKPQKKKVDAKKPKKKPGHHRK